MNVRQAKGFVSVPPLTSISSISLCSLTGQMGSITSRFE